jgi:PIN domain nuclease of toxin-antitoxin system
MKVLLDTQTLFWWFGDDSRLSKRAGFIFTDAKNTVLVSAATASELAIKFNREKSTLCRWLLNWPGRWMRRASLNCLSVLSMRPVQGYFR